MRNIPLFHFAFHPYPDWLEEIKKIAKDEPWGSNSKILELYLRANFEIAKSQSKVYENKNKNIAFWRAGHLVNLTSDPIWLVYQRNTRDDPYWRFNKVHVGDAPEEKNCDFEIMYEPPSFNKDWGIHFEQASIQHILSDTRNKERLDSVFGSCLKEYNEHLIFRAIYGEIQLKRKEEVVLPQWYQGDYKFLMPLFLTRSTNVELTAALEPEPAMKRYFVKTLLFPNYAYAYARALVKSRASFADWMMLSEDDLEIKSLEQEME